MIAYEKHTKRERDGRSESKHARTQVNGEGFVGAETCGGEKQPSPNRRPPSATHALQFYSACSVFGVRARLRERNIFSVGRPHTGCDWCHGSDGKAVGAVFLPWFLCFCTYFRRQDRSVFDLIKQAISFLLSRLDVL